MSTEILSGQQRIKMLTIGEPMAVFAAGTVDCALKNVQNWEMHTAGAELNVAIGVARLGLQADYISAVGDDPFGHFLLEKIGAASVGTQYIELSSEHRTGIYFKQRVSQGDPEVFYMRADSAATNYDVSSLDALDLSSYQFAHLSGIFPAISDNANSVFSKFTEQLKAHDIFTTYDPNIRLPLWGDREKMVETLNFHAKSARLILPGVSEGEILVGTRDPEQIATRYFENSHYTKYVVIKLGADGALLVRRNGGSTHIPGFKVEDVVDTVGAGDGFAAGLMSALMDSATAGKDVDDNIESAVRRASAIGALAVTKAGDNEGYPTRSELEKFMEGAATV